MAAKLLSDDALERSAVVANCRMNRERELTGSNGYAKEIGFHPLDRLKERQAPGHCAGWLDLCCGSGRALIEAARVGRAEGLEIEIVGVDLVGMFLRPEPGLTGLRLVEASLSRWEPDRRFDLITCVHGLHYVGDKLGMIARAASWLAEGGLFVATLDLDNLKSAHGQAASRTFAAKLRRAGLEYDRKKRLVLCRGRKDIRLPCRYLGADPEAGPNFTGQPAVNSHYDIG
jgi:SAM-dependent methyltransferase